MSKICITKTFPPTTVLISCASIHPLGGLMTSEGGRISRFHYLQNTWFSMEFVRKSVHLKLKTRKRKILILPCPRAIWSVLLSSLTDSQHGSRGEMRELGENRIFVFATSNTMKLQRECYWGKPTIWKTQKSLVDLLENHRISSFWIIVTFASRFAMLLCP